MTVLTRSHEDKLLRSLEDRLARRLGNPGAHIKARAVCTLTGRVFAATEGSYWNMRYFRDAWTGTDNVSVEVEYVPVP